LAYILAIDQGTTATKAALVDGQGQLRAAAQRELAQHYPQPGWVEMDACAIWRSVLDATQEALTRAGADAQVAAVGVSNQGESVLAWDAATGEPLYPVITWQCTRTAARCRELSTLLTQELIRQRTGLVPDPYFSASKLQWLLEHVPAVQAARVRGTLRMGTLDTWLLWRLSGGRIYATDWSTASRTMLFDVRSLAWDDDLLALFGVPRELLAAPRPSGVLFGTTDPSAFLGISAPLAASAVDQPAALWGHGCFRAGELKITYGTGAFLLMHLGATFRLSARGLLTSLAASCEGEPPAYYLDGGIYSVGAAIQWLRHNLGMLRDAAESGALAASLPDNGGVYFVPALVGLAAPHWDRQVQGAFLGLTSAATRAHLARAVLEAIAFRVYEVIQAMEDDAGVSIPEVRADGGVTQNDWLMQFQADLLRRPVRRARLGEMTALGIAQLAGAAVGFGAAGMPPQIAWDVFAPGKGVAQAAVAFARWQDAMRAARAFR